MVRARTVAWVLTFCAAGAEAASLPRFPDGAVWNQNVSGALAHPDSTNMIATLAGLCDGDYPGCGFGFGRMQIDFSIRVVHAPAGAPTLALAKRAGYYLPDCDDAPVTIPVPAGATIEGQDDMTCANEDCHYLVVQGDTLYEVYIANQNGGNLQAQCLVRWDLTGIYPPEGRGEHCTSADAAGFPMAPLLFSADDVYAATLVQDGDLGHAIRFVLPNDKMANDPELGTEDGKLYVHPATHSGAPSGPKESIPYGSRLRLRPDFPMTGYNAAAQVILRTMQRYGIVLSDGGGITLTAENDLYNTHKWAELGMDPDDGGSRIFDQTPGAADPNVSDFAVIDTGPRIGETYECVRAPPPASILFEDGFETP